MRNLRQMYTSGMVKLVKGSNTTVTKAL